MYEKKNNKFNDITKFINESLTEEYKLDDPSSDCIMFWYINNKNI